MGPTTVFCPNWTCPARGQRGQGTINIHSRKDQRFICTQCHKIFTATQGTVFYRLRTAADTVTLVLTARFYAATNSEILSEKVLTKVTDRISLDSLERCPAQACSRLHVAWTVVAVTNLEPYTEAQSKWPAWLWV